MNFGWKVEKEPKFAGYKIYNGTGLEILGHINTVNPLRIFLVLVKSRPEIPRFPYFFRPRSRQEEQVNAIWSRPEAGLFFFPVGFFFFGVWVCVCNLWWDFFFYFFYRV